MSYVDNFLKYLFRILIPLPFFISFFSTKEEGFSPFFSNIEEEQGDLPKGLRARATSRNCNPESLPARNDTIQT